MTLQKMISKILSHYETYRSAAENTGIAASTMHDIKSGKTNVDKMHLSTYKRIKKAAEDIK